jgi:RNA polymerase sigma-70 factor (ECF subfamily)
MQPFSAATLSDQLVASYRWHPVITATVRQGPAGPWLRTGRLWHADPAQEKRVDGGRMQPEPEVTDSYLVARARDGYLDAYEMLVQRHSAMAYRVALRLCGDHHDAQDIAQESLIAAWQNLARFKGDSSFSTWLYQIVTRRALNKVTRGRAADQADLLDEIADAGTGPAKQAERNLAVDAVTAALAALPFPQRMVIVLHHFEGLSYAEVAKVTHSSVPAVRSHLFRARRTLGKTLEEWR